MADLDQVTREEVMLEVSPEGSEKGYSRYKGPEAGVPVPGRATGSVTRTEQGVATKAIRPRSWILLPVSVNKDLLEPSQAHSFTSPLCFCTKWQSGVFPIAITWPSKVKIFTV